MPVQVLLAARLTNLKELASESEGQTADGDGVEGSTKDMVGFDGQSSEQTKKWAWLAADDQVSGPVRSQRT